MSFLDDLLIFKRPIEQGKELIRVPRTYSSFFTSKTFMYKAHETKAGLYAVLPQRKDGSLYVRSGKGEVNKMKLYQEQRYSLRSDFYLHSTHERREKERDMVLESTVMKSASHNKIRLAVDISVSYSVTREGIPSFLKMGYDFPSANGHYKKVQFTVCRSSFGEAVAEGLIITPHQKEILRGVNYEATLGNLVGIILRAPLTNQDIFDLFSLKYVKRHVLH